MATAENSNVNLLLFVVDVLRHDIESLSSVIKMLNSKSCVGWRTFWPHDFTSDEVIRALEELRKRKWIEVLHYSETTKQLTPAPLNSGVSEEASSCWFKVTAEGQRQWEKWEPPRKKSHS